MLQSAQGKSPVPWCVLAADCNPDAPFFLLCTLSLSLQTLLSWFSSYYLVSLSLSLSEVPPPLISEWWPLPRSVLFFFIFASLQWSHPVALSSIPTINPYFYPHRSAFSPEPLQLRFSFAVARISHSKLRFWSSFTLSPAPPTPYHLHFNKRHNHTSNSQARSSESS